MQKGFAHLFLIITILSLFAFGLIYFYKGTSNNLQTPKTTIIQRSEFKDYTNADLGFKFQYPNSLTLKQDSEQEFNKRGGGDFRKNFKGYVSYEPGKFLAAFAILDKTGKYDLNPFTLWVFDNPNNLTIEDWYKNYWYYPFVWGDFTYTGKFELAPKMESTISGQMAKSGIIDYQPGKPKFIYLPNKGRMYLFRIIDDPKKLGDKILSSFKLLGVLIAEDEKQKIDKWLVKSDLNKYGDPKDIAYAGGTPLFNEATGQTIDRYDYILEKHPNKPWDKKD